MSTSGFLLDTNVVSEALQPRPDVRVLTWLRANETRAWLSVVTIGEIEAGTRVGAVDALIAAMATQHGLAVATRNGRDFERLEVEVVDPWAVA